MMGIFILTSLAFIVSFIIILIDSKLNIEPGFKEEIEKSLPGYNCGACGFGSCHGMSEKILENTDNYHSCRMLKDKKALFAVLEKYGRKVEEQNKNQK